MNGGKFFYGSLLRVDVIDSQRCKVVKNGKIVR